MKPRKPKSLEDFPKFIVTAVRCVSTWDTGYTRFELDGSFDRVVERIDPRWFWLLFGEAECLCASVKSLDRETRAATLTCDEKSQPMIAGKALAYLSPCWQAFHVWMVLDPRWGWERKQFHGSDAVAEDYESTNVSIVEGHEVKVWTKMEPLEGRQGQSRHYPAADQTLPACPGTRLIPLGWGHEHCELCKAHIDAGQFGYCDPEDCWMCEKCFGRYAAEHNLAFVDEL